MKKALIISTIIISFVFTAGLALAKSQEICPVMGGKINKEIHLDADGKRVYFCCPACLEPFKKDPAKYIKKLEDDGVVLEKAPAKEIKDDHGHDEHAGHNH